MAVSTGKRATFYKKQNLSTVILYEEIFLYTHKFTATK